MDESILYSCDVPLGWSIIKFADACDKISLNGIKIKQKEYLTAGEYPVVDQGQELVGGFYNDKAYVVPQEPPYVVFGDHTKVKKYINFSFIAGADGIKVLKPQEFYNPKLLFYFLYAIKLPDKGYARHFQFLEKSEFPLPPLSEQHHIVAKIEELFSELDKGVEALKTAQQQLKVYRQAVLKWAFEGKLTEEWRESNKSKIESASVLLERINEERKKRPDSKYKGLKLRDILGLPGIPDGWLWSSSSELCSSVRDGTHDTPKYVDVGIPLITSKNLNGRGLDFSTAKNISIEDHKQINIRSGVEEGDILFAMIGTIGNPVVVKSERAFSIKNVALFKKNRPFIVPEYLKYWFEGLVFDKLLEKKKYLKGTTQRFIPLEYLRILPIPFCCCQEQNQIVQEIESRLSVADKIEESIAQSLKQAEALRQSILKRAFSGKLVPQDPNDEPAEKLLARIKAERAEQPPVKEPLKRRGAGRKAATSRGAAGKA